MSGIPERARSQKRGSVLQKTFPHHRCNRPVPVPSIVVPVIVVLHDDSSLPSLLQSEIPILAAASMTDHVVSESLSFCRRLC